MIKLEEIKTIAKGKFLELKEVFFEYKGRPRRWEVCSSMDSVAILIYDKDLKSIVLVKQFRLPVYLKNGDGFTYELCAGLCDKDKCSIEIAREEVLEECGYDVDSSRIKKITSTWASVGTNAANQTIYYVEVEKKDKIHKGGGVDDEDIEVFYLDESRVEEFVFDETKVVTPGAKFALLWWLYKKNNQKEKR
ncbi:MAG: NUDIX hydrolase [Nautiliaceae bacterium]